MACENRTWPLIHAKLKTAVPLKFARDLPSDIKTALAANPDYPALFNAAYGTPEINTKRIAFAIATHERRLTSNETPWDRFNAGETDALTPAQRRGYALFLDKGKCAVCHAPPLFTDLVFHNLGFINSDFDNGRQAISGQANDKGKVKTPTLRNVALREPAGLLHFGYGTGANLDAVMGAYNEPPNADGSHTDAQIEKLNLTPAEIADMTDFMRHSLTDPRVAAELPPFDRPKLGSEP
jgi:cytochrome c peroxidase